MTEEKAPDATPVTRDHVDAFLKWYRTKIRLPHYTGIDDHWAHALQTLTLGDLRNGIRWLNAQTRIEYVEPVKFWHLCKNRRAPETDARIRAIRESLRHARITDGDIDHATDKKTTGGAQERHRR